MQKTPMTRWLVLFAMPRTCPLYHVWNLHWIYRSALFCFRTSTEWSWRFETLLCRSEVSKSASMYTWCSVFTARNRRSGMALIVNFSWNYIHSTCTSLELMHFNNEQKKCTTQVHRKHEKTTWRTQYYWKHYNKKKL